MKCLNCGNEIKEGQKFCINCGTPVPQPEDTPAQDTVAQTEQPTEQTTEQSTEQSEAAAQQPEAEPAATAEEKPEADVPAKEGEPVQPESEPAQPENITGAAGAASADPCDAATAAPDAATVAYSTAKSADAIVASIPRDYKPLTIWQFFGYEVLFSLPLVGVIASLIFALDASRNINLTNFARARFLWTVVETMITLFMFLMMVIRIL